MPESGREIITVPWGRPGGRSGGGPGGRRQREVVGRGRGRGGPG